MLVKMYSYVKRCHKENNLDLLESKEAFSNKVLISLSNGRYFLIQNAALSWTGSDYTDDTFGKYYMLALMRRIKE